MSASIFAKTPGELTDAELRVAITEVDRRRREVTDQRCADFLSAVLDVLCDERDARIRLRRAVDDAVSPFRVVTAGLVPDE